MKTLATHVRAVWPLSRRDIETVVGIIAPHCGERTRRELRYRLRRIHLSPNHHEYELVHVSPPYLARYYGKPEGMRWLRRHIRGLIMRSSEWD